MAKEYQTVDSVEALAAAFAEVRAAQRVYSAYAQEQVDKIFIAAVSATVRARIPLAKMSVGETGMGVLEDKVIKNHHASEYAYNTYKDEKTCGLIEEGKAGGLRKYAEPLGVIASIIPVTNPTSAAIFKTLLSLKTRNGMILVPHPQAKGCTAAAAKLVLEAAVAAGAPEGIIRWIDAPNLELSSYAMKEADCVIVTGKPAIGMGSGNAPVVIDESADIPMAASAIIHSKVFDNGMACAPEQAVIALDGVYNAVRQEFASRGCHFLTPGEIDKVRKTIIVNNALNTRIIGQPACKIAEMAGVSVPEGTKVLIGEVESVEPSEEFSREKLSPVLAMYKAQTFDEAADKAARMISSGGPGHTASIYINGETRRDRLESFAARMKARRVLVNFPASLGGGTGAPYNFLLEPSLTLGCGSRGGNSVSGNLRAAQLLNIKTVEERMENMLWFRAPEKIYVKRGCLPAALDELRGAKKRAFVVTDEFLYKNGYTKPVTAHLEKMGIAHDTFFEVEQDPTMANAKEGAKQMSAFKPDVVIAIGGGSPMDAAKIMWALYEHPEFDFMGMAMRFMDIRKRVCAFPKLQTYFIAIPTTAGTGSEVTPFAVITDETSGIKHPLADYELLPDMAIVDADLMMDAPKGLTAASGIDAVTHALEAYVSVMATDYTDSLAVGALQILFEYLPRAYGRGAGDPEAREKVANAATMAGIAFANAFLGICHSMSHKLGSFHNLSHGIANALLISEVIKFNAAEAPARMGFSSQYDRPKAAERYAKLSDALGFKGTDDLIQAVEELKCKIGIKKTIRDYGVDEKRFRDSLDDMTEQAFDDQCTGTNPRYPLMWEIRQLYLNAYYGKDI